MKVIDLVVPATSNTENSFLFVSDNVQYAVDIPVGSKQGDVIKVSVPVIDHGQNDSSDDSSEEEWVVSQNANIADDVQYETVNEVSTSGNANLESVPVSATFSNVDHGNSIVISDARDCSDVDSPV